jgi:WhiB family redox-sensing transcriptional regulator
MAEVSWMSDYVSTSERARDRAPRGDVGRGALLGVHDGQPFAAFLAGFGADDDAMAWQERALCAETDPEAFFPEKGGSTREAKKICTGCEVKAECLEYALANDERFGIWGGLSERERRRLRRRAI